MNKRSKPIQELNYSTKGDRTFSYGVESARLWVPAIPFYKENRYKSLQMFIFKLQQ